MCVTTPFSARHGVVLVLILFSIFACRSEPEVEEQVEPEVEERVDDDDRVEERRHVAELYGLPLPPEYFHLQRQDYRVRVSTEMSVEEIAQFFEEEAVDYEVFRIGSRVEVLPLRSHSGRANVHNYGGRNGYTVINYRRPPDGARAGYQPLPEPAAEQDDDGSEESTVVARRDDDYLPITEFRLPQWVEERRGEPVELRDEQGQLLAPGARWGEPYIPPEGSPLHHERYRHLWGRPYGAW